MFRLLHVLCLAEVQLLLTMVLYAALKLIYPQILGHLSRPKGAVLVMMPLLMSCVILALTEGAQQLPDAPNCLDLHLNIPTLLTVGSAALYCTVYVLIAVWAIYSIKEVSSRRNITPSLETVRLVRVVVKNYFIQILLVAGLVGLPLVIVIVLSMFSFTGPSAAVLMEASLSLIVSYSCVSTAVSIFIFTPYRIHTLNITTMLKSHVKSVIDELSSSIKM
uniref:G_PROTEIN_RECEP_F1_2 domain-containing protein n=1 Tax=Steinernema glaseri TaxID=37863 RepID=A0A1I8A278_9BILA